MSTTIDQRILEMRFDNKQFESNIQTSMSTLDRLKQSLNLSGASKGLEEINNSTRRMNFAGLSSGIETVQAKFSALQVMGVTALANITNSAVNAGKRIASALTIDPIKTGFQEYETQINAVQTILANTSSKGTTLKDVNGALDQLNTYADKTIYNFTEMTRNIGTFTAAGVDLDTSVSAIQGIANLAAVSGSSSQQASTAMYQLSQALAAGKVNLQDWNSVVNAGMGGQVFQDALKRTAKVMGKDVDGAIEKYGSFRESLSKGNWLTTDVLTKTLEQFTLAAKEGSKEWDNYKKSLMEEGYTEKQATEILKMANTATDAATKVKTFTQLWDTLKEAAQSGWTQTWEIIVGDFEEAKSLLTSISDTINGIIGESAKARNDVLQGWKDAGGRDDMLEGFKNIWEGLVNIATPIKEAFDDIFPSDTNKKVKGLLSFTKGFKKLTNSFKEFTNKHGDNIRNTFKGIFSVIEVGVSFVKKLAGGIVDIISHFTGLGDGILGITGSIGKWLTNVSDAIKKSNFFGESIDKIVGFVTTGIDKVKTFGKTILEAFNSTGFEGFFTFFKGVWDIIQKIGSGIGKALSPIMDTFTNLFQNSNLFDVLNSGLLAGGFLGIGKIAGGLEAFKDIFDGILGESGAIGSIKEAFGGILDTFTSYQNNLNAGTLQKIAIAIGILAASIFVLSTIKTDQLYSALTAITVLFGELMGSLSILSNIGTSFKGVGKAVGLILGVSVGILILSAALKNLSSLDWEGIGKGLVGVGGLMAELAIFSNTAKFDGKMVGTATGIVILSAAMLILAKAVEDFGAMSWEEIGKGLAAIGGLLAELAIFTNLTGNASHVVSTGASMVLLGAAMKIFASAVSDFASMSWEEIGRGLTGMAGALLAVTAAVNFMPKNMVGIGVGLLAISGAMVVLANALGSMGGMSWEEIGRGLAALGGAMAILAIGLNAMNGTLGGSAALLVAAGALAILTPVLNTLGNMSWQTIVTGLLTIAGAFAVLGVAGALLGPLVPTILALSASFALFGVGVVALGAGLLAIGAGLTAIGIGFTGLATAGAAGATAFVAALTVIVTGLATLIPVVATELAKAIITFCVTIGEGAPKIAAAFVSVITAAVTALVTVIPLLVNAFLTLITSVLTALAEHMPDLLKAATDLIVAFIKGITDNLPRLIQAGFDLIISFIDGLATAITENAPRLISAIKNLLVAVVKAGLSVLDGAVSLFKDIGSAIMNSGLVKGIGSCLSAVVNCIKNIITKGWNAVVNFVSKFLSAGKKLITNLANGIKSCASAVINGAKNIITKAYNAVVNFVSKFLSTGKKLINNLLSGIKSRASAVVTCVKNMITKAYNGVINFVGKFLSAGKKLITNLVNGIKGVAGKVKTVFTEAVDKAKTAISNKVSSFTSIGKNIINGLKNGIKNAASGVIKAAKGVVSDAISGAKKLLGIKSPSRVFAGIGRYMDEGLIVGIKSLAGSVAKTTTKVGQGAVDAMSSTISNLGSIAEDVLSGNTQPTIRPVLDLSNIQAGAGEIDGMFGMTPSVGLLNRVGSLSSMMDGYGQNGGNDDVVSAINKLRKDLGNVGGTTYQVGGITYNDDTPIAEAVGSLVRAITREGRV